MWCLVSISTICNPNTWQGRGTRGLIQHKVGGEGGGEELILTPLSPPPYLLQGPACPVDNL